MIDSTAVLRPMPARRGFPIVAVVVMALIAVAAFVAFQVVKGMGGPSAADPGRGPSSADLPPAPDRQPETSDQLLPPPPAEGTAPTATEPGPPESDDPGESGEGAPDPESGSEAPDDRLWERQREAALAGRGLP